MSKRRSCTIMMQWKMECLKGSVDMRRGGGRGVRCRGGGPQKQKEDTLKPNLSPSCKTNISSLCPVSAVFPSSLRACVFTRASCVCGTSIQVDTYSAGLPQKDEHMCPFLCVLRAVLTEGLLLLWSCSGGGGGLKPFWTSPSTYKHLFRTIK